MLIAFPDQRNEKFSQKLKVACQCRDCLSTVNFTETVYSKQSRVAVDLPHTCHPSPRLTTFAFGSRQVGRLLFDMDPYGGTDPLDMFPIFLRELLMF